MVVAILSRLLTVSAVLRSRQPGSSLTVSGASCIVLVYRTGGGCAMRLARRSSASALIAGVSSGWTHTFTATKPASNLRAFSLAWRSALVLAALMPATRSWDYRKMCRHPHHR
jgi:hypothetical protein